MSSPNKQQYSLRNFPFCKTFGDLNIAAKLFFLNTDFSQIEILKRLYSSMIGILGFKKVEYK